MLSTARRGAFALRLVSSTSRNAAAWRLTAGGSHRFKPAAMPAGSLAVRADPHSPGLAQRRAYFTMDRELEDRMLDVFDQVCDKDPYQKEFQQAVREVLFSLTPLFEQEPEYLSLFEQICEPEQIIQVKVPWVDRNGTTRVNRAWRVQYNQALGPYKGGTRFFGETRMSTIKFLAFEQTLTNALIPLSVGGAFGGADFETAGRTEVEVLRFCQSYMNQLYRHIGPDVDVLSGDLGCSQREIGFMFGQWRHLTGRFAGTFTDKGQGWGGSAMRLEGTGFGVAYFARRLLEARGDSLAGKRVIISGAGRVGLHAAIKFTMLGAKVLTLSDSSGFALEEDGFSLDKLEALRDMQMKGGKLEDYCERFTSAKYGKSEKPWTVPCDVAVPCAIENDILAEHAHELVAGGCMMVIEGANMPSHDNAVKVFRAAGLEYVPAKAAGAGGAVISGLEMAQNAQFMYWDADKVDKELDITMCNIHDRVAAAAARVGVPGDLKVGANVASFAVLADAMRAQGFIGQHH